MAFLVPQNGGQTPELPADLISVKTAEKLGLISDAARRDVADIISKLEYTPGDSEVIQTKSQQNQGLSFNDIEWMKLQNTPFDMSLLDDDSSKH